MIIIGKMNIDTAFKIAWDELLGLDKITYTSIKLKKALLFKRKLIWSDDLFVESNH